MASSAPPCKSCFGLSYYSRALNDSGKAPRCIGFSQKEQGDVDKSDIRQLSNDGTRDFKYYCLGYSNAMKAAAARAGQEIDMPYCEGVEVVVMEEKVQHAHGEAGVSGQQQHSLHLPPGVLASELTPAPMRSSSMPDSGAASTSEHISHAPSSFPSDAESAAANDLRTRFVQCWHRNVDLLCGVVTGEQPLLLPLQPRKIESVSEVPQLLVAAVGRNLDRMQAASNFLGELVYVRTLDAAKQAGQQVLSRFRSEPEEEGSS